MTWVLRGLVLILGLFFASIAVRGIIDPLVFTEAFGVVGEGAGRNTLRADFGAFFLLGSIPTIWVAIQPHRASWLILPIIQFCAVLGLRILGVLMGDQPNMIAMGTEAAAIILLLVARRFLSPTTTSD